MQEIAERETPGAGSGQLQVIRTPDTARDRRSITVEVGGRLENISLAEMEFYCDLFEEMFDEFDRREPNGVGDLLREHGADYVNVTEEVWAGRTVDPGEVKERVEERQGPVGEEKLYGFMPKALMAYEGAPLVSLGKVKGIGGTFPSLALKNLFGLIPDPLRSWWHGPGDARLGESIVDIARVYASYFPLYGVCEAFREATAMSPEGEVKVEWGRYDVVKDLGFASLGGNLMNLDAVTSAIMGVDPSKVSYLTLGEEVFGPYDRVQVERAKAVSGDWIPIR